MGLGLAISHSIVAAHGGRLWADEARAATAAGEGEPRSGGATFRFTLPLAKHQGRGGRAQA